MSYTLSLNILSGGSLNDVGNWTYVDNVYKFNKEFYRWDEVGNLQQARSRFGASVVNKKDFEPYCI